MGIIITGLAHVIFLILFLYLDIKELVIVNIFSILVYIFILFIADIKHELLISWIVFIEIIAHALIATYYIGYDSGFHYYIYNLVFVPYFAYLGNTKVKIFRMLLLITIALFTFLYFPYAQEIIKVPKDILSYMQIFNIASFLFIGALVTYLFNMKLNQHVIDLDLQSNTDHLTGLYNRRYFLKAIDIEIQNDVRYKDKTSLLMLDIDFFKQVNDTYGHDCGDYVINNISKEIKNSVRPHDIVARWGGEEYLILMPKTNEYELEIIAQRIRKNIANHIMQWQDVNFNKTVSLGGAIYDTNEDIMDFIARSDSALYKSKNNGRNCYTLS